MIADFVARLADRCGADFGLIEGAAAFAALDGQAPPALPACYVLLLAERAGAGNGGIGPVRQRVEIAMATITVTSNLADAQGSAAVDEQDVLRESVRLALMGWEPVDDATPVERGDATLIGLRYGCVWIQTDWRTAIYQESN